MNKLKISILLSFAILAGGQKLYAQFIQNTKKTVTNNWQNLSFDKDGVYGAEIDKAYSVLKDKKPKKKTIVAIIGHGIDIEHEDLQGSIWTNPKEKDNQQDDDNNGLTDDLHGWNYLGNSKGEVLDKISRDADREFMRLKDKGDYRKYIIDKDKYYLLDKNTDKLVQVLDPENKEEMLYLRETVTNDSHLASKYFGLSFSEYIISCLKELDQEMRAKYPDKELTRDDMMDVVRSAHVTDTLFVTAVTIINYSFGLSKQNKWAPIYKSMMTIVEKGESGYRKELAKTPVDDRKLIGDNYLDITDTKYGNNILLTENAGFGTLFAGIIGAKRNNGKGIDGIADNVEIMTLRVEADETGEPYMKDLALAIRYAVDHGADIVQMPKPNTFYPVNQSDWVNNSLVYAEEKGVLVVIPVWDLSADTDIIPFYPNRQISETRTLSNIITVAASNASGSPLINANYGKNTVDLFAPGVDIYSTFTGDTYRSETSSRMAASVVAGAAALIKSYYPDLTGRQLRDLFIENVTSRSDIDVEKEIMRFKKERERVFKNTYRIKDLVLFDDLCQSAGILNVYKALSAAGNKK